MSIESIAVVISAAGLLLGFVAAFAWMIRRVDGQIDKLREDLGDDIKAVRQDFNDNNKSLGERIAGVERELVEVKLAIARLEGPPRHLVRAR